MKMMKLTGAQLLLLLSSQSVVGPSTGIGSPFDGWTYPVLTIEGHKISGAELAQVSWL
jgi:hypothetical protein